MSEVQTHIPEALSKEKAKELIVESLAGVQVSHSMLSNAFDLLQSLVQDGIAAMIEISPEATEEFLNRLITDERMDAIEEHSKDIKNKSNSFKEEYEKLIVLE